MIGLFLSLALSPLAQSPLAHGPTKSELVVYGATPAGIAMAVRAARDGHDVLLVHYSQHLGGMIAEGLSVWDTLYYGARAPLYDELRQSIYRHYREKYGIKSPQYKASLPGFPKTRFEAHLAEQLVTKMVAAEPNIKLIKGHYPSKANREGPMLTSVTFSAMEGESSLEASAKIFADCSYEGDLAAIAAVPCRIGREARSEFGEPHAGIIYMRSVPWPPKNVDPAWLAKYAKLRLFHYKRWLEIIGPPSTGAADDAVQAYNLRTILTTDPNNRIPIAKPEGYDPEQARKLLGHSSGIMGPLPNKKYCWNNPELVGIQNRYVTGTWPERQAVIAEHRHATLSLLYFLQNDPSVSPARRDRHLPFGLPKDEFADNGHMPREVYVREARRIEGRQIFTEHDAMLAPDLERAPIHADSISFTEWFLDSHGCLPKHVKGSLCEGEMLLNNITWPGQVSYETLLPKGTDNLLVPVCLSATHVGWGTIRLEPTWMAIAESAACAAHLALESNVTPAAVDGRRLIREVAKRRILITFFNDVGIDRKADDLPALVYLGSQGFFGSYNARPTDPLTPLLGEHWAIAAGELVSDRKVDVNARARQMQEAEQQERRTTPETPTSASALTHREFAALLAQHYPPGRARELLASHASAKRDDDRTPITRGEACKIIFETTDVFSGPGQ